MGRTAYAIPEEPQDDLPIAPTIARWRAMSARERDSFVAETMAAVVQQQQLMSEGVPHARSKSGIREILGDYFARIGRKIYLASELTVYYPGERVFTPDLLAVRDIEDPGDEDTRMAWIVADEGQGIDLALEITHHGNRHKDLAVNVADYARLGISEYFIYDLLKLRVLGYRLPSPSASHYRPIPSRGGMLRSEVLGLDVGLSGGKIRFFAGGAQIPETRELLARANDLLDDLELRAEEASRRADEEARRAEEEARRADEATQRAQAAEAARAAIEAQLAALLAERAGR